MAPSRSFFDSLASVRRRAGGWRALGVVAVGGLIGSTARTATGRWLASPEGDFPTEILVVNLCGSLLLGFFLARRERALTKRWSVQFWAIGILGSFTTFSTFSVDLVTLLAAGRLVTTAAYGGASLLGGLICAWAGQRFGAAIG